MHAAKDRFSAPFASLGFGAAGPTSVLHAQEVVAVATRLRCTPSQIALAWALDASPNVLVIPGTSSLRHLEENLAARSVQLNAEAVRELSHGAPLTRRCFDYDVGRAIGSGVRIRERDEKCSERHARRDHERDAVSVNRRGERRRAVPDPRAERVAAAATVTRTASPSVLQPAGRS